MRLKLIFALLASYISLSSVSAQTWDWAHSATGNDDEQINDAKTDSNGNIYVTGYFASTSLTLGTITINNTGINSGFLAKYDSNGVVIWAKSWGGNYSEVGYGVNIDPMGNIVVVGSMSSDTVVVGSTTLFGNGGSLDIFIAKYSPAGVPIWAKRYGSSTSADAAYEVSFDAASNIYFTGYFGSSPINFDGISLTNSGAYDCFVAKMDLFGIMQWAKKGGGTANDYGMGIATDVNGNSYVTGYFSSNTANFSGTTITNNGQADFFIAKYNNAGVLKWIRKEGGAFTDQALDSFIDNAGDVYACGSFASSFLTFNGDTLYNTSAIADCFLVKFDTSGNFQWIKGAGGYVDDAAYSITQHANGNIQFVASGNGTQTFIGSDTLINAGNYDIYIGEFTTSGNYVTNYALHGSGAQISYALDADNFGNTYLAGHFTSANFTVDSTILTNTSAFTADIFVAKLNITYCNTSTSSISPISCGSHTLNSQTYTSTGTYTQTLINAAGCDSTLTINLTINTVDVSVTIGNASIMANSATGTYQWLDCINGFAIIAGETNQIYTAPVNGYYAVMVTDNGCVDTSACVNLFSVGLNEMNEGGISFYPNPSNGQFLLSDSELQMESIKVMNVLGETVYQSEITTSSSEIDLTKNAKGLYFIRIKTKDNRSFNKKIIIE